MAEIEYIKITYDEANKLVGRLYKKISDRRFNYDAIIAVGTGGFAIFRMFLDRDRARGKKEPYSVVISTRYSATKAQQEHPILEFPNNEEKLKGRKILILDDVADEGKTLAPIKEHYKKISPDVKVATLHIKPACKTLLIPDFYIDETAKWIIYPWEPLETIKDRIEKQKEQNINETIKDFKRAGFTKEELEEFISINKENEYGEIALKLYNAIFK